jgi:L-threonylcarbamoyladenylate synthase
MLRLPFVASSDLLKAVAAVREVLSRHGVVAVPTETFYGLAVDPHDREALSRIYRAKNRASDKALSVVGASLGQLEALVEIREPWRARLDAVWPAPLTVVLPARRALSGAAATLAVRVPAHDLLRRLLFRVGPLTATSANVSGGTPTVDPAEVERVLGARLDLLLDGGRTPGGSPSTLLDCTVEPPIMLREGEWDPPEGWSVKGG